MPKSAARALLTDFLKTRRARLQPSVIGITEEGNPRRRRSVGLRRSEVAKLAGISTEWYTLFEMGQERAMTVRIIEPVARALQLNEDERDYLYDLVRAEPPPHEAEGIPPSILTSISLVDDLMVVVYDRWQTPMLWNRVAEAILGIQADEPLHTNAMWRMFFRPDLRKMYVEWRERATQGLGIFRRALGRDPTNPQALRILAEMEKSEEFTSMWAAHDVVSQDTAARATARQLFHIYHPRFGIFSCHYLNVPLPASAGGFAFLGTPGDEAALRTLATANAHHIAEHGGPRVYGPGALLDAVQLQDVRSTFTDRHAAGHGDDLAPLRNTVG